MKNLMLGYFVEGDEGSREMKGGRRVGRRVKEMGEPVRGEREEE